MELSALLFALGLLLAGVWLIFTFSGDFKSKKMVEQQGGDRPHARLPARSSAAPPRARRPLPASQRQSQPAPQTEPQEAPAPQEGDKSAADDQFAEIDAAVLHQKFEKFRG